MHMLVRRGGPGRVGAGRTPCSTPRPSFPEDPRKLCEVLSSEGTQAGLHLREVTAALWLVSIPRLFWAHSRLFLNEPLQCLVWFFGSLPPFLRRSLLRPAPSASLVSFCL